MMKELRIATRGSALALWQANHVRALLLAEHPGLAVSLLPITTRGDQIVDRPLAEIGGKGLFVKELERALLAGEADIAVHSMKDVPGQLPAGLHVPVVLAAADPRDALVSPHYRSLDALPQGARIGTSSLRRQCQLKRLRADLRMGLLRGNLGTRLAKLDAGEFDALLLAGAGLERMGWGERIAAWLVPELMLPAVAQGIIGIECRQGDAAVAQLIAPLADAPSLLRVTAERAFSIRLGANCEVPVAALAQLHEGEIRLRGLVGRPDGSEVIEAEHRGRSDQAAALGCAVAEELLARGARQILVELGAHPPLETEP